MLPVTAATIRAFLHVTAAIAWVAGGAGLVWLSPRLVEDAGDELWELADRVRGIALAGFFVLVATGIWNLTADEPELQDSRYGVTLLVKLALVAAGFAAALRHRHPATPGARTRWAWLMLLSGLATVFAGLMLHT